MATADTATVMATATEKKKGSDRICLLNNRIATSLWHTPTCLVELLKRHM